MKKILLLPLIILSIATSAQTFSKRFSISTEYARNFVIPEYKNARGAWSSIIMTSVGYYLKENTSIGLNVNFHVPPKNVRELLDISTMVYLSPFGRFYKNINDKVYPFLQVSPKYGFRVRPAELNFLGNNGQNLGTIKVFERHIGGQFNVGVGFKLGKYTFFDTSLYVDAISSESKEKVYGLITGGPLFSGKNTYFNTGLSGGLRIVL
jgi:hypothetical protein